MLTIQEVYTRNISLIYQMTNVKRAYQRQNYDMGLRITKDLIVPWLNQVLEYVIVNPNYFEKVNIDEMISCLKKLLVAQEKKDYLLVADLYEIVLLPTLYTMQAVIQEKEEFLYSEKETFKKNIEALKKKDSELAAIVLQDLEDGGDTYSLEYAQDGSLTLNVTDKTGNYYFHSSKNPWLEGNEFAKQYYLVEKERYLIYGFGLGYHIASLLNIDDGILVEVYENDIELLKIALRYIEWAGILSNPMVKLIYDADNQLFSKALQENNMDNVQVCIHYSSLRHCKNEKVKKALDKFFIQDLAIQAQRPRMESNFRWNIKHYDNYIDELKPKWKGKNLIIVAAGPSLDKNIELLYNKPKNTVVLATGTVFRKLIHMEIVPDYVIVTDANQRVYGQMYGLENKTVPILILSTANKLFSMHYQGKKYLICQKEFDLAENYGKEKEYQLYATGGSVSTTALELGIQLECKRIIFIGLDLAYTNQLAHASDTSLREVKEIEKMQKIKAIDGKEVYASQVFLLYRDWIEGRIQEEKRKETVVEFIDATEGGALIQGMKIMTLSKVIEQLQMEEAKHGEFL